MSNDRLFIYDKETNTATVLAKGYPSGWLFVADQASVNEFFDGAREFSSFNEKETRYELRREGSLPKGCEVII